MPKPKPKRPRATNQLAYTVVQETICQADNPTYVKDTRLKGKSKAKSRKTPRSK